MSDSLPDLQDTSGVDVSRFTLDWDTGGGFLPDVDVQIHETLTDMFWTWYLNMVSVQIWVLDWILAMDWLSYLLAPLAGLGLIVQSMVAQIGLLNLMLIILAFVVGFWLLKGRYAGGFMELLIGCVIAALATGYLADPMRTVAGDDGVIMQSRDAGMDIATGFATDGANFERNSDVIREGLKGQLVDTLIRTPHQIINYGGKIDGSGCENTYTDAVGTDDAAERIGGCDDAYADAAAQLDASATIDTLALLSTGFVFLLLSVVIVGGTVFAVLLLGWSAIKLLWQLPVGVVASGTRAQLFRTAASIGLGCILVAMATMFLVAWMKMLLGFYDATSGMPFLVRLYLFNTLVIAGAVFYVLMGASVRAALRGLADKLATAGVPSQVSPPQAMPWDAANRSKWAERLNRAKEWSGVGLGPTPAPVPEKNATKPEKPEKTPAGPTKGQTMDNPDGTRAERDDAAPANPWTTAATQPIPVPGPTEAEKLTERLGAGVRAGVRVGTAAAGGPAAAAAVGGSKALADGLRTMRDRDTAGEHSTDDLPRRRPRTAPSTAVVPEPYTSGRGAHVPSNQGIRRESLLRALRGNNGRRF